MNLNFFPIKIETSSFSLNSEPYSDERIKELRASFNSTKSFFRNGDKIYISDNIENDETVLGSKEIITCDNEEIVERLIKHVFFRNFKDKFPKHIPTDFYPFRFYSSKSKDDIIFKLLPSELQNKISYRKLIELQLRKIEQNGKMEFGFVINIRRNWVFNISCAELHNQGFDLIGMEVLHAEILPGMENILGANEEFIGKIERIENNEVIVDTNNGLERFQLSDIFIRKTKFNIGNFLNFKIGQLLTDKIFNEIKVKSVEIYNAENIFREINNISKFLFSRDDNTEVFTNNNGFSFSVNRKSLSIENSITVQQPTFIFDYAGTKTDNFADRGLSNFGPYDSSTFDTKTVNILCLCHKNIRGSFSNFLAKLKDGDPNSRYFKKGLLKKYELQNININIEEISEYNYREYNDAISRYNRNSENKPDFSIIEIPENFKLKKDKENPYYKLKAKLLSSEIPVQFVTTEKVRSINEYILNSIGLQIYAKLGGTAWVLPTKPSVDREIVIGIGHSWIRSNSFKGAEQSRIVGITTFLASDGQYILGEKIKDVEYENYFEELLNSLADRIGVISKRQAWNDGETVRLIFHIFKPIKNVEFDVISELIKSIKNYKIQFAFVTISKSHPFILFDQNQNGVKNFSGIVKGKYIPNRSSNVVIDSETCIMQMQGASELKTSKHGMSAPLQIKIRKPVYNIINEEIAGLIYYDLRYIVQQIYSFTYLSWRGFLPAEEPATMLYSNLISKLLGKLRNVPGWNADNLNYGLKMKKWFL